MPVALRGQMRGGTIIPLAVPAGRRTPEISDVPTLHELGFPALVVTTWFAIAAPAGLPRDITARVNQEIATARHRCRRRSSRLSFRPSTPNGEWRKSSLRMRRGDGRVPDAV
ncbi:MAG: hypothetical protein ACJ8EJ_23945 [Xanthobacteraceae bacterium]